MLEYLTVDPKNLTVDPAWLAGVNSVNFGVNSEIYKNHTIDPSYSGRVNSEINCCNTFDGPDGTLLEINLFREKFCPVDFMDCIRLNKMYAYIKL